MMRAGTLRRGAALLAGAGLTLSTQGCLIELPDEATPVDTAKAYPDEVLADGPLAYWRFAETEGIVAADATSKHPGEYHGDPELGVPGLARQSEDTAVRFDGIDDAMVAPNALNPTTSDFSLEAIIELAALPSQAENRRVLFCAEEFETSGFRFGVDFQGHLVFWTLESGGMEDIQSIGAVVSVDAPTHVAVVVRAGATATLYLNGVEVVEEPADVKPTVPPLDVGAAHNSLQFAGVIDEVAVYDHAVLAERLVAHARAAGLAD